MRDERHDPRVIEQVTQLAGNVAVVDVDGNGTQLEAREHRLEVLGAVPQIHADVVARSDPALGKHVGEPIRSLLDRRVRELTTLAHQSDPVGDAVDHRLPYVGEVVGGERHRTASFLVAISCATDTQASAMAGPNDSSTGDVWPSS